MATVLQTAAFQGALANAHLSKPETELLEVLERSAALFDTLDISGMHKLVAGLNAARLRHSARAWPTIIADFVATHRIRPMLHEDPLTRHAFQKPRGYPGDAALLDLIYGDAPVGGDMTRLGALINRFAPSQPSCRSVRERREILARLIDRTAAERPMPRVLSLACGHLREAQRSEAVRARAIGEIVAVDQDPLSLEVVARESNGARITPVRASIRRFLVDPSIYGEFDLIYSAGLYDYLDDETAKRLTTSMFAALRPGGSLVVANFAPELPDIGYMEAVMDWRLIYRDERGVAGFCDDLPADLIREQRLQRDSGKNSSI
jgi:SAM-dependent methyltransferase